MDPYRMLGVSRGCTPEEVKAAFRAIVPSAHPDHGGEDLTFIQIHAAYEQVLAEADTYQRLAIRRPIKGAHDKVSPTHPDPAIARRMYRDWVCKVSARSRRRRRKWVGKVGATFLLYLVFSLPATGLCQAVMLSLEMEAATSVELDGTRILSMVMPSWQSTSLPYFLLAC